MRSSVCTYRLTKCKHFESLILCVSVFRGHWLPCALITWWRGNLWASGFQELKMKNERIKLRNLWSEPCTLILCWNHGGHCSPDVRIVVTLTLTSPYSLDTLVQSCLHAGSACQPSLISSHHLFFWERGQTLHYFLCHYLSILWALFKGIRVGLPWWYSG